MANIGWIGQCARYEACEYGCAMSVLQGAHPLEWSEILFALDCFTLTRTDILTPGGNESPIPSKFDMILWPRGWREIRIVGDLSVRTYPRAANAGRGHFDSRPDDLITIENFIDGHNVDFVKNRVAFDLEWNSKDQTFDRDINAFRTYHDVGLIDVGIIVTRSITLNPIFKELNVLSKYGASTTHMGKLIPRLESRRQGGCPVLAIGITDRCYDPHH